MLELTTEEEIELDERQFATLVLNRWGWAKQFSVSNRSYVQSDVGQAYLRNLDNIEE